MRQRIVLDVAAHLAVVGVDLERLELAERAAVLAVLAERVANGEDYRRLVSIPSSSADATPREVREALHLRAFQETVCEVAS